MVHSKAPENLEKQYTPYPDNPHPLNEWGEGPPLNSGDLSCHH